MVHHPPHVPARPLTTGECRRWLESHQEGRLRYRSGCGDRAVPVVYAVDGDEVLFRVPEYNPMLQYAVDAPVTLEVSGPAGDEAAEEVTVHGTAHPSTKEAPHRTRPDEEWPPGVSTHLLGLPLAEVAGDRRPR